MENYKQKNLCKEQLDLDDYFMQKIVGIDFNGDTLRVQVKDRADLTFSKVKIDFAALKFFNGSEQDIMLYSLYIFNTSDILNVDMKILCGEKLYYLIFTAQKMI